MTVTPDNVATLAVGTVVEWSTGGKAYRATKVRKGMWRRIVIGETFTDDALVNPMGGPVLVVEGVPS